MSMFWRIIVATDHLGAGFLAVHESLGDDVRSEQLVSLPELLEEDPVGKTLAADPDSLQYPVTAQLIQHQ